MSLRLPVALSGAVAALALSFSAFAGPARYAPGSLDARLPVDTQGYFCVERPGLLLTETAALFARLRDLGGSDEGWKGLAARAAKANLLTSLDSKGLEKAGLDANGDVCVWVTGEGDSKAVTLVWPVVDVAKAWDTGRRLAVLIAPDDVGMADSAAKKKPAAVKLPVGAPNAALRVGPESGGNWIVIRDGLLMLSDKREVLDAKPNPDAAATWGAMLPTSTGERRGRAAFLAGSEDVQVPVGMAWFATSTGWTTLLRGGLPMAVTPFAQALAPDEADQAALAKAVEPYVPAASQVVFASLGLERLIALLSADGDPLASMPPLVREGVGGLRGSFAVVLPQRATDTRLILPLRDTAKAVKFVEELVKTLNGLEVSVQLTRKGKAPRVEFLLEVMAKDPDLQLAVLPVGIVIEPDRMVVRLVDVARPEASPKPLASPPATSVLHAEGPMKFEFAAFAALLAEALPFTRGGLREGVSWGEVVSLMVAEVRSNRTNLTLQPGHAAYRSDIESAPLTAGDVPEAYREAMRAVFAGDSVAYGEALSKVLATGAGTYWGKRAHDELYAPSSWMSLYSAASLVGVVLPMLQGIRNSSPAMPDMMQPMPEVTAP
jgi:hypothetical protein